MLFVIVAILALALVVNPGHVTLSGRIVAVFCFFCCLTFAVFLAQGGRMPEMGSLAPMVSLEAGLLTAHGLQAVMLLCLAAFMSYTSREYALEDKGAHIALDSLPIITGLLAVYATLAALYIIYTLGIGTVLSYQGYGTIKALHDIYIENPLGKLVAGTFRFVVLVLIAAAILALNNRRHDILALCLVPIALAFLLGIAEASRIIAVYCALFAIGFYLIERKVLAVSAAIGAVVLIGYVLEARSHPQLGLSQFPRYFAASLSEPGYLWSIISNAFASLLVTSAAADAAYPGAYDLSYKILSFSPTIGAIDGFQDVRVLYEQRISYSVPFNAFGEAWAFGIPYYVLFWAILFVGAYCVNSSLRFGKAPFLLLLAAFVIGLMFASQYPVRNSVRYFYALILARFALGFVMDALTRNALRARGPARSRHLQGRRPGRR